MNKKEAHRENLHRHDDRFELFVLLRFGNNADFDPKSADDWKFSLVGKACYLDQSRAEIEAARLNELSIRRVDQIKKRSGGNYNPDLYMVVSCRAFFKDWADTDFIQLLKTKRSKRKKSAAIVEE